MSEDFRYQDLATFDPEVHAAIVDELARQRNTLEMIASENFVPRAVLEAQGSVLTNKYAEGYPGKRYYGGCEHVDVVETLAQERAKEVFGAKFANVQPHSGAQANAAVLMALAEPGDTIPVSYTHLRAHETPEHLVCRLLLEKKKKNKKKKKKKFFFFFFNDTATTEIYT